MNISTPLISGGKTIGALSLGRYAYDPFTDAEVALLETFAAQAVIAIENARLFEELERRNAELGESNRQVTESLEQQTATAEVLRVIASSPTDLAARPRLDRPERRAAHRGRLLDDPPGRGRHPACDGLTDP